MIRPVAKVTRPEPATLVALRRASRDALDLARRTNTPAWIMDGDALVDAAAPGSTHGSDNAKQAALAELSALCQQCHDANGGEGAEALSERTHDVARRLLASLPGGTPLPSVTAEPDGQLNFEWYQSPKRLLSVSVSESGTLYWAALIETEDPRGSCQFTDRFPQTLLYWIGQVYA